MAIIQYIVLSHSCKIYRNLYIHTPHLLKRFSTTLHYLLHFLTFICPVQQKLFPVLLHPHRCNSTLSVWPCGQGSTQIDLLTPQALLLLRYAAFCLSSLYQKRKGKHCTTHKAKKNSQHKTHLSERGCKSLISQHAGEGRVSWCIFSTVDSGLHR